MEVVGELRVLSESEERPGHSTLEWSVPSFVFHPKNSNNVYCSAYFEFLEESWYLNISKDQCFNLYISKEGSTRACSVHLEMFKRSDGMLTTMGKRALTFKAERWNTCLLHSDGSSHIPEHVTFVLSFITGRQHRVTLLKSTVDIAFAANSSTEKESFEHVDASTQTESDTSNSKSVKESSELKEPSAQTQYNNCTDKLSSDLNQLLLSGEDSDLTIRVKGTEFCLHRGIMGVRTPVFSAMLRHDMKEKATGIVCIDDCEPEVFQAFTRYLYSGMVNDLSTDTVFELFALADKYRVDELKSVCLEFIQCSVSVDTFCDVVNLALTFEQGELLKQVTDFFAQNIKAILPTVKWMNFMSDHPIQANELMLKAVHIISK